MNKYSFNVWPKDNNPIISQVNLDLEPEQATAIVAFCNMIGLSVESNNMTELEAIEKYMKEERYLFHLFCNWNNGINRGQCYAWLTENEYLMFQQLVFDLFHTLEHNGTSVPKFDAIRVPKGKEDYTIQKAIHAERVIVSNIFGDGFKEIYSLIRCQYNSNEINGYARISDTVSLISHKHIINKFNDIFRAFIEFDGTDGMVFDVFYDGKKGF